METEKIKKTKIQNDSCPDGGELFLSKDKKYDTLIFFVHFFKGHKKALKRHIEHVNQLGFDAYGFNLKDSAKKQAFLPYSHRSKKFGMKHALADQIEEHFNLLGQYKTKIIFSFSNVSGSAMEFMARHFVEKNIRTLKQSDILAMICDSGPGADFIYACFQLAEHQFGVKFTPTKAALTPIIALGWSPSFHKDVRSDLEKFPEGFPILSIRGWKDPMLSPKSIDQVFEPHKHIRWKKLSLPQAAHLNGLRDFPSEYIPAVDSFLCSLTS